MTDTLLAFYGAGVGLYPLVFGMVEVSTAIDEMFAKTTAAGFFCEQYDCNDADILTESL